MKGQRPSLEGMSVLIKPCISVSIGYLQENKTPGEGRKERREGRKGKVGY